MHVEEVQEDYSIEQLCSFHYHFKSCASHWCSTHSRVLQHQHGMRQSVVVVLTTILETVTRATTTDCPMPCTRHPTQQHVLLALTLTYCANSAAEAE
jgi:hypothetical protein